MSNHNKNRYLALTNQATKTLAIADKEQLLQDLLTQQIHGLCFSPYIDDQAPGANISAQQIQQRLSVIANSCQWIRSFSCTEGHQQIPEIAKQQGLKTLVGIWLDDDLENNEIEINNAIMLAKSGHVDILAVGNEVLLREDLTPSQLLQYINRIKQQLPDIPIGYVDAYYLFELHPDISAACDVILANCYPFWESCPAEYALLYMKDMYQRTLAIAQGKPVIITETGWPSQGTAEHDAIPSYENAITYFIETYLWAQQHNIAVFYFSAFDENWKVSDEGDVGAFWGLWDSQGQLKYSTK